MSKQSLVYIALSSFILLSGLSQAPSSHSDFIRRLYPHENASHSFTTTSLQRRDNSDSTRNTYCHKKAPFYSSLVAIGASFTDDGHPRFAKWNQTLRQGYPYSLYDGRYTNGRIAVEYMVDPSMEPALKHEKKKEIVLRDYAYGGSVIKNDLGGTGANSPAAVDQIATYLSDLKDGMICGGNGRVLHYFNSGINPVNQIWYNAMSQNFTSRAKANAVDSLKQNMEVYATAIESIAKDKTVKSHFAGIDFVLVGIPPLEIVPSFAGPFVATSPNPTALEFLGKLTKKYNSELEKIAMNLKKRHKRSRVFFFDLARLWSSLHTSPSSYNLSVAPITTPCFNTTTGALCREPETYLYWDDLHPTTAVHRIMAEEINSLVLGITKEE